MIMKKELEALLIKKFPILYQPRKYPLERRITPFRFKCGDGWYTLIDTLSELLVGRFPGAISEGVLRDDEGTFLLLLSSESGSSTATNHKITRWHTIVD